MEAILPSGEQRAREMLAELGLPISLATQYRLPFCGECRDLVSIGRDLFGREQWLERGTALQWSAMHLAAKRDGVDLAVVSAFRSFENQRQIIARKLAAGLPIEQILRVSALPGFSEHHTGRAVDIGTSETPPLTEAFEQTSAFDWLTRRAHEFDFRMSYPRDNRLGMVYEPWHWLFNA